MSATHSDSSLISSDADESPSTMIAEQKVVPLDDSTSIGYGSCVEVREDETPPPPDKYRLVYMIFILNGIGVLLPWNMFITIAPQYYVDFWFTYNGTESHYGKSFMSMLGITAQVPNVIMSIISVSAVIGGPIIYRIIGPLTVNIVNVAIILLFVIIQQPSEDAQGWFYAVSLTIVMIMNASNGLYQNSMFGMASDFPFEITNGVVVGTNICGTFTSVLSILTTIAFPDSYETIALIYFSISMAVLILCEISLFLMTRLEYYQYYIRKGDAARKSANSTRPSLRQFWEAFKYCWIHLLSIWLIFTVSLSVFPTILVDIVPTPNADGGWNSVFPENIYAGITCFLNFNLFAAIGSTTAWFIQFPKPRYLIIAAVVRVLFIPFFLFCNYDPDYRLWPVWFSSYWWYTFGNTLLAFTSGYLSSLGLMYAPGSAPPHLMKIAGSAGALALVTGIMSGVALTPLLTTMVENI